MEAGYCVARTVVDVNELGGREDEVITEPNGPYVGPMYQGFSYGMYMDAAHGGHSTVFRTESSDGG